MARKMPQALEELREETLLLSRYGSAGFCEVVGEEILNRFLEGMFGNIKERVKIPRGLDKNRKKKAVRFLLKKWGRGR
jgi:hypothetical protein